MRSKKLTLARFGAGVSQETPHLRRRRRVEGGLGLVTGNHAGNGIRVVVKKTPIRRRSYVRILATHAGEHAIST